MDETNYRIHWVAVTIHAPDEAAFDLYDLLFKEYLGEFDELGNGGRGFKKICQGLLGIKIYLKPSKTSKEYFHLEIPGMACDVLPWTRFQALFDYLELYHQDSFKFTRLDIAYDNLQFTPKQVESAILNNDLRTLAKRSSFNVIESPFQERDNGDLGTKTVYLGSRSSERMLRVYNSRGFTRLEFQTRGARANLIARDILDTPDVTYWEQKAIAHLRDFVDFHTEWWTQFISSTPRAGETISTSKELAVEGLINWIDRQVSPGLSVLRDLYSDEFIDAIIDRGRNRRGFRYNSLLSHEKTNGPEASTGGAPGL